MNANEQAAVARIQDKLEAIRELLIETHGDVHDDLEALTEEALEEVLRLQHDPLQTSDYDDNDGYDEQP